MSEKTPTLAALHYGAHKSEAEDVTTAHQEVYEAYYDAEFVHPSKLVPEYDSAMSKAEHKLAYLEIAHMSFARGLRRNTQDYQRVKADYIREAVGDAVAAGVQLDLPENLGDIQDIQSVRTLNAAELK